jgi:MFS transporter, DHA1 family, inner membrane transport protein
VSYFANRSFNLVYVHAALQAFASYGGEAFAFVYLLKAGVPAPLVLLAIGAMFGSRMIFRQLVLPLVRLVGLRRALIVAILAEAATYPILSQITGTGWLLFGYLALWAFSSSLYWTTYHSYVALMGDNHARGKQTSAIELIGMGMGILAPAVTGLLLTAFSPIVAFGTVAIAMALSTVPVLFGPDLAVADQAEMPREARVAARTILFADGLRSGSFHFTWLIALFLTLGSNYAAFGGAMALSGLVGAVGGLFLGRAIDLGRGLAAVQIGFAALGVAAVARMFGWPVPFLAVAANAAAALAWPLYATAFNARVYNLARQSPCPLRFHIVAEGGWDLGTCLSCLAAAALLYMGFDFHLPLAIGVLACGLGYLTIARTFRPEAQAVQ